MTAGTLVPEALRLPAAPLLAAVDQAAHDRRTSVSDVLGKSGQKAYARARAVRKVTLAQVETVCDRLGCHPYELYGPAYQRLALASGSGPLEPEVTVTAWHLAACTRQSCARPIRPGELVRLVADVGPCCAGCCGLDRSEARSAPARTRPLAHRSPSGGMGCVCSASAQMAATSPTALRSPAPASSPTRPAAVVPPGSAGSDLVSRPRPRPWSGLRPRSADRMSTTSRIEWTQTTWNPVTGCDRISPGCQHCYALTLAGRLQAMGQAKYQTEGDPRTSGPGFGVAVHPQALIEPLRWGRPRLVFVNSMSDLFHARVPDAFIAQVFAVMAATGHHTYQILTKRPGRMARLLDATAFVQTVFDLAAKHHGADVLTWPMPNLWVGTSVETQQYADQRIPKLLKTPAATRFLSCEPLLGPLDLRSWLPPARSTCTRADGPLTDADRQAVATFRHQLRRMAGQPTIDWVIAGGESGPGARPMRLDWVRTLRDQAADAGVAFFCKQLGSRWARDQHADPKGGDWTRWPTDLRVRAWPPVSQGDAR